MIRQQHGNWWPWLIVLALAAFNIMVALALFPIGSKPAVGTVESKHYTPVTIIYIPRRIGNVTTMQQYPQPERYSLVVRTKEGKKRSVEIDWETYESVAIGDYWGGAH